MNICLFERSKMIKRVVENTLTPMGHKVYISNSLEELYNRIIQVSAIIVIVSSEYVEALNLWLEEEVIENTSIVVLTGNDDIASREEMFKLGIAEYITKDKLTESRLRDFFKLYEEGNKIAVYGKEISIAVLDNDRNVLNVIKKIFSSIKYDNVTYYITADELLKNAHKHSMFIIDLIMPKISGEEVMVQLKTMKQDVIVVMMSSIDNHRTISNLLLRGADDYVVKPFDKMLFLARIHTHIRTLFLGNQLMEKNRELERLARTDGLTGLYNHNHIIKRLDEEISRINRAKYGCPLSVAIIDIDHFKKVNDKYGHVVGDEVLREFAKGIITTVRKTDIIGRYGGEEFLVIYTESDLEAAKTATYKLLEHIRNVQFDIVESMITFSAGIIQYNSETAIDLVAKADQLLYIAKENGRNRIEF